MHLDPDRLLLADLALGRRRGAARAVAQRAQRRRLAAVLVAHEHELDAVVRRLGLADVAEERREILGIVVVTRVRRGRLQ